ncbi:restriction endonuclease subunit S [Chryseobacterium rhizoplanae]|uniref:restriction endonuclease subunit S n=1 Tax=Chryseobacterium rhizoplanae TaxID=1609531 RepID=UPI001CE2AC95|nr:restriction endonuclease subunit S [Chryseobacterium rhizoplanae]UCA61370.1 restriction endonuclease subunit S [Chryseobacterium rhizoplanae]
MAKVNYSEYLKKLPTSTLVAEAIFAELYQKYKIVKISSICKTTSGGTPLRSNIEYYNGNIPWLKSGELNDSIIIDCEEYISDLGLKNSSAKLHPKGTLLLAMYGATAGKVGFLNFDAATNQAVCAIFPNESKIEKKFLYWFLRQHRFKFIEISKGGAQPNISQKLINETDIVIPPIELQLQIIETLTKIEEENQLDLSNIPSEFHTRIKSLFLIRDSADNISLEINHQLNLIKDLRQAFLREAMQGKLVSNETSDGKTGADLLAEIQAEKALLIKEKKLKKGKLTKNSKFVSKLQLPESWIYTKLDHLFFVTKLAGFEYTDHMKLTKDGDIPVIRAQNVRNLYINKNNLLYIDFETSQLLDRCSLNKECLLITFIGAGIGDVASFQEKSRWHLAPNVAKAEPFERVEKFYNIKYFNYFLISDYGRTEIKKHMKATAQPSLSMETIRDIDLPLPPFEIQERIVSKLDVLMQYCDELENSVKESQQYNEMLLQQVLREALEGKEESKPQLKVNKTCDNNDTAILASYIIQELHTPDFGRTKLQKIIHLAEYHCRLETPLQYYKKTAGPYSKNLENDIENLMRRNKLYDSKKEELKNSDKSKVNYIPLSGAKQINSFFITEFKDQKEGIDNLLKKFNDKPMEFCEMISTMYAVWNNRLIKGEIIDDEELKKDFLAWDAQKIKFLDKLDYSIEWIKKEGLVPTGFGKYIDKQ